MSERLARCGVGAADLRAVEGDPRVGVGDVDAEFPVRCWVRVA